MIPHCVATNDEFCAMTFYGLTSQAQQRLRAKFTYFSSGYPQKINSEKGLRFKKFIWEVIPRSTVERSVETEIRKGEKTTKWCFNEWASSVGNQSTILLGALFGVL